MMYEMKLPILYKIYHHFIYECSHKNSKIQNRTTIKYQCNGDIFNKNETMYWFSEVENLSNQTILNILIIYCLPK